MPERTASLAVPAPLFENFGVSSPLFCTLGNYLELIGVLPRILLDVLKH